VSDILVLHESDNTAVALRDLAAGDAVRAVDGGEVTVLEPIPAGHKLALEPIAAGAAVRKYGAEIGTADADIARGAHVHVHNVHSERLRGDR
jgi:altronate dehydratase